MKSEGSGGGASIYLSYSYYQTLETPIDYYRVAQDNNLHIGIPQHKISFTAKFQITETQWKFHPSIIWYGKTYANKIDQDASGVFGFPLSTQRLKNRVYVSASAYYTSSEWEVGFGIKDIFDEGTLYPQPFQDVSTPYPGPGRQIWGQLSVRW